MNNNNILSNLSTIERDIFISLHSALSVSDFNNQKLNEIYKITFLKNEDIKIKFTIYNLKNILLSQRNSNNFFLKYVEQLFNDKDFWNTLRSHLKDLLFSNDIYNYDKDNENLNLILDLFIKLDCPQELNNYIFTIIEDYTLLDKRKALSILENSLQDETLRFCISSRYDKLNKELCSILDRISSYEILSEITLDGEILKNKNKVKL